MAVVEANTKIDWSSLSDEEQERYASQLGESREGAEELLENLRVGGHLPETLTSGGGIRVECSFCGRQLGPAKSRFSSRLDFRKACPASKDHSDVSEAPYTVGEFIRYRLLPYLLSAFVGFIVFGFLSSVGIVLAGVVRLLRRVPRYTRVTGLASTVGLIAGLLWASQRRGKREAKRLKRSSYRERQRELHRRGW